MTDRMQELQDWVAAQLQQSVVELAPASGDASFRRYFRVADKGGSRIVMDAPPDREDCEPFVRIAGLLAGAGLNVPQVLAQDLAQGFLLLSDLGDDLYLDALDESSVERLYADALGALSSLQAGIPASVPLPPYDRALLMQEMELFRHWLVGVHCGVQLAAAEQLMLDQAFELLAQSALDQPQVCVHRDYHSRNLMLTAMHNPGVLDFQDAVRGPVTYDLVSLLKDCYIRWPWERVEDWALGYRERALQSGVLHKEQCDEACFLRWMHLMGAQRHLKAAGIFARLLHRDGKNAYMKDVPRTLDYILEVAQHYPELEPLAGFIRASVLPELGGNARVHPVGEGC